MADGRGREADVDLLLSDQPICGRSRSGFQQALPGSNDRVCSGKHRILPLKARLVVLIVGRAVLIAR